MTGYYPPESRSPERPTGLEAWCHSLECIRVDPWPGCSCDWEALKRSGLEPAKRFFGLIGAQKSTP